MVETPRRGVSMGVSMALFKNKYCIESTRLKDWDYSAAGFYFIIIFRMQPQMNSLLFPIMSMGLLSYGTC